MSDPLLPRHDVEIVEVGPRDGFQPIGPFIPTERKLEILGKVRRAGLRRIEIGSFASIGAVPQLADTPALLDAVRGDGWILPQILVPSERYGRRAIEAGVPMLAFVLSVSEPHNSNNVRRTPAQSAAEYENLMALAPDDLPVRLNIATAFDCPFAGRVPIAETLALLERLVEARPDAEICLCDTTGRADPDHMRRLFGQAMAKFPAARRWAMHAHDTYGLGLANVVAAYGEGVRVFDAAFAGLGGCPFAPGATGNVATEDVAWMFERMGVSTGVDLDALLPLAEEVAALPGAQPGGRVRLALAGGTPCKASAAPGR